MAQIARGKDIIPLAGTSGANRGGDRAATTENFRVSQRRARTSQSSSRFARPNSGEISHDGGDRSRRHAGDKSKYLEPEKIICLYLRPLTGSRRIGDRIDRTWEHVGTGERSATAGAGKSVVDAGFDSDGDRCLVLGRRVALGCLGRLGRRHG